MELLLTVAIIEGIIIIIFIYLTQHLQEKVQAHNSHYSELESSKKSMSVKYGKTMEQFIPFMSSYPYDYTMFRFLGTPIDGLQFTNDAVVFMEFKTNTSQLNDRQVYIKKLIQNRQVRWEEIRI